MVVCIYNQTCICGKNFYLYKNILTENIITIIIDVMIQNIVVFLVFNQSYYVCDIIVILGCTLISKYFR